MQKEMIEQWYEEECRRAGEPPQKAAQTPFLQKMLAFSLVASLPVALTGCVSGEAAALTAEQECQWEMETYGLELDCEDEDSDWYLKKGINLKRPSYPPLHRFTNP